VLVRVPVPVELIVWVSDPVTVPVEVPDPLLVIVGLRVPEFDLVWELVGRAVLDCVPVPVVVELWLAVIDPVCVPVLLTVATAVKDPVADPVWLAELLEVMVELEENE